jgi:hypothetical protein
LLVCTINEFAENVWQSSLPYCHGWLLVTIQRKGLVSAPSLICSFDQVVQVLASAGATLVEHFTVSLPSLQAEWGSPPFGDVMLTVMCAKIVKACTTVVAMDKLVRPGGILSFPPACHISKLGRPGYDAVVAERGKPVCSEQLPVECLR